MDVNEELIFFENLKRKFFLGGGSRGRGSGLGAGWGVRVDVNKVFKFFGKFTKKSGGGGEGRG